MCQLMGHEEVNSEMFTKLDHQIIARCTGSQLKSFVMTRKPDLLVSRLPNKGKLESALQGEKNLISLVYECKMMPNKIHDQLIREKLSGKDSNLSTEGNDGLFTLLNVTMMQDGGDTLLQDNTPSILLNDVAWIS